MSTVKMKNVVFPDKIFSPMKTGTPMDEMFSYDGGIFPATNYMLVGDPGSGKTTIGLDVLAQVQANHRKRKVLFISAEMNRIDMFGFAKRYPKFSGIDILFTGEFTESNIRDIIEKELEKGYDLVLADSFMEIQECVMESNGLGKGQAEKWLIDLMNKHNLGKNKSAVHTSFIMIQQVTKGGIFAGSNKLKHITTGMCELKFSKGFNGERYLTFSKNRRGCRHERLFYSLESNEHVGYDQKRLERDLRVKNLRKSEEATIDSDSEEFDKLFNEEPPEPIEANERGNTFISELIDETPF